jgi:BlaI family transcriptional regulator, penicillinase repressor
MRKTFSIFALNPSPHLGPFEQQLLREVWARGTATVRELIEFSDIHQAYTTVMTTMDRLYKKGLLRREIDGRAFRYSARFTPEELQRGVALNGILQLLRSGEASALPLSYLVEALSEHDAQLLDELQALIERKRRELKDAERTLPNGKPGEQE